MSEDQNSSNQSDKKEPQFVQRAAENSTLFIGFFIVLVILFIIYVGGIGGAFLLIGFSPNIVFNLFVFSVLGSFINLPIHKFEFGTSPLEQDSVIDDSGIETPSDERSQKPMRTRGLLAINLGGALIPIGISLFLVVINNLWLPMIPGLVAVSLVTFYTSRVIPKRGISLPVFLGPIIAAMFSVLSSPIYHAQIAYITGTLGTLIGADILNIQKLLESPDAKYGIISIGGAGTFDGVFLTGIIAVFISIFLP